MEENGKSRRVAKARKAVAQAESHYKKVVAKGEEQIVTLRTRVDARAARAKQQWDTRATDLAKAEARAAKKQLSKTVSNAKGKPAVSLEVLAGNASQSHANGSAKRKRSTAADTKKPVATTARTEPSAPHA